MGTSQTISLSLGSDITCVNGPRMTLEGHEWPCYIIVVPVLKIGILLFFEEHRTNRSRVICPACFRISKILLNLRKYRIYSTLITWFESRTTHDQTMKWTPTSSQKIGLLLGYFRCDFRTVNCCSRPTVSSC